MDSISISLSVLGSIYLVLLMFVIAAVVLSKITSPIIPSPQKSRSSLDDLFVQRFLLVFFAASFIVWTLVTALRANHSHFECVLWNWFMTVSIGCEKSALFMFLFFKQDVIKTFIQEPRSKCDKIIMWMIPLVAILAIVTASTTHFNFDNVSGCAAQVTTQLLGALLLAQLLDFVISITLLRSFLSIIKRHMKAISPRSPSSATKDSTSKEVSSQKMSEKDGHSERHRELQAVMKLNSRSCVICVGSFTFTVVWAIIVPMLIEDSDLSTGLINLVGITDVFIDCAAMFVCSPQIWKAVAKQVLGVNSANTEKTPADEPGTTGGGEPKESGISLNLDSIRKPTFA